MDLDDAKTGKSSDRTPDMKDLVAVFAFPVKKWTPIRLYPGIVSTARYWVKTKTKDGKGTKFPTPCPSYDPETQERDSTKYDPWRDLQAAERQKMEDAGVEKEKMREKARIDFEQKYWMGAIIRSIQKEKPAKVPKPTPAERKSGFKDKESDSWTAKRVVRLGKGLADKIKQLKQLNISEGKAGAKAFSVDHPKYGIDVRVYYDPKKAPADQYQVQMGTKRTPLTEEELAMLGWDLEGAAEQAMAVADEKEIKRDFESWASRNGIKVAAAAKKKGKSRDEEDEDDEDSDDEDFDDEDDEDEPPKKKGKKPVSKSKKKPVDDDEDEDEDDLDDDEDDEDEDEPPKKKGKKPVPKKGKKSTDEDEDEDDFDEDEDEDEDEEEPAPRKKGKKKPADEDEDDFEEDEDEPPKKTSKKAKPAPKKGKKPVDDDDLDDEDEDEDDLDDDEDDEDEDEPPKKKGKAKPAAKKPVSKSKKKPVDDDEDEDDEDEDDEDD